MANQNSVTIVSFSRKGTGRDQVRADKANRSPKYSLRTEKQSYSFNVIFGLLQTLDAGYSDMAWDNEDGSKRLRDGRPEVRRSREAALYWGGGISRQGCSLSRLG